MWLKWEKKYLTDNLLKISEDDYISGIAALAYSL